MYKFNHSSTQLYLSILFHRTNFIEIEHKSFLLNLDSDEIVINEI